LALEARMKSCPILAAPPPQADLATSRRALLAGAILLPPLAGLAGRTRSGDPGADAGIVMRDGWILREDDIA
jgi:hypothetical protein